MNYQFVSTLPTPVLIVYLPTARVLHINPAGCDEWGYTPATAQELSLSDVIAPLSDAEQSPLEGLRKMRRGRVLHFSADILTAFGDRRRYQFAARAGVEEEPKVGLLTAIDISDQYAAARASEDDARRLRALVESNFDVYYDWHIADGFHEWSHQMEALLGLAPGSFPSTLEAWMERLHPSQRDAVTKKLQASVAAGGPYHDEYLLRREDGEYRFVADRGVLLFDEDGKPTDLVGVIRDITQETAARVALEESEELYRTLFQATTNPALRTDERGQCLDANQAAVSFLRSSKEDLLRTRVDDHFGVRARAELKALSRGAASDREAVTVELTVGESEDQRTLVTSIIPIPVGGQHTYFWLGTDVTRLRRLNAALEQSQGSLETQAKALEEYSVALKVILEQGRQERLDLQQALRDNVDRLVLPMLDRLDRLLAGRAEASYLEAIRQTLGEIAHSMGSPRSGSLDPMQSALTRRELEIARLVKIGKSTDEISAALHISSATVSYHRKKIRSKLGLGGKKTRLVNYLLEPGSGAAVGSPDEGKVGS